MAPNKKMSKKTQSRPRATVPKGLTSPVSVGGIISKRDPKITNLGNSVVITNSERFTDVGTAGVAGNYVDSVLPLIPSAFAWLSGVAQNYTRWQWESLEVFYIPQCSTTTNGLVGMAFIYDPRDGPITSMSRLSVLSNAVLNPPWAGSQGASLLHTGKVHPEAIVMKPDPKIYKDTRPYISFTNFTGLSSADQLIYASLWIDTATANSTSTSTVVGGLYIRYRVRLSDPIVSSINN